MGLGGSALQPRLHITESLEECRAMEYCGLFEEGDLLLGIGKESLNYFDVDYLEVWAVGGEDWIADSLAARQKHRDVDDATNLKARKVDKKELLRDFQGGLLGGLGRDGFFGHVQQTSDRCDV